MVKNDVSYYSMDEGKNPEPEARFFRYKYRKKED